MSTNKLAALRAQFAGNQQGEPREQFTNKYYPFWNMKPGQRAVIRFLPDKDSANPRGFLVERVSHTLTINGQTKTVPCLSMYEEDCPICKLSQEYYKVNDKVNGKKYWRKKQYIAQAIIVEDPLPPDATTGETHLGQVRHIALGYQLFNIIKEAFAADDGTLDAVPYDFSEGYDFIIKKTEQGEYSTYTMGSKFHTKQRPMTEDEILTAETDMIELRTLLPRNPGVEKVQAMLNADINGEDYSEGEQAPSKPAAPAPRAASRPAPRAAMDDNDDDVPFDPPVRKAPAQAPAPAPRAAEAASGSAPSTTDIDDMIAQIRNRRRAASE